MFLIDASHRVLMAGSQHSIFSYFAVLVRERAGCKSGRMLLRPESVRLKFCEIAESYGCVLQMLGDWVMRPFLQDTIQFWPLSAAMTGTLFVAPLTIMRVLIQVCS